VPPQLLETVVGESVKVPARVWRATFQAFLDTADFSGELGRVTAPTLIVWGDRDAYAPRGDQERLLAVLPRARQTTYEGAGHGFHWEDPRRFAGDLERFLAEDVAAGSSSRPPAGGGTKGGASGVSRA
jgi:pimeloyl-ACP methyl ester carboxylesterase